MSRSTAQLTLLIGAGLLCQACTTNPSSGPPGPAGQKTLTPFSSQAELKATLSTFRRVPDDLMVGPMPDFQMVTVSGSRSAPPKSATQSGDGIDGEGESVTNTQSAGVDEGGIVKLHGKHLVMLRRGRLFTVKIGDNQLQAVAAVDVFSPEAEPDGWYDEMLISGNTVVVIGYSYRKGGTEIGLFDIGGDGQLSYRATYHLRSNDYYSLNSASRVVGSKLILYTELRVHPLVQDPMAMLPALRKWRPGVGRSSFKPLAPASRVYRADEADHPTDSTLHTITECELTRPELACQSSVVLGPRGQEYYVSTQAVYVWTTPRTWNDAQSTVFRIPLGGAAPTALKAGGTPVDQFSFLEGDDGYLNVLLNDHKGGDAMWDGGSAASNLRLLRVPVGMFSDASASAERGQYRLVPKVEGDDIQNRFIGNYLLYGRARMDSWRASSSDEAANSAVHAVVVDSLAEPRSISLAHEAERIEAMGKHAVVIGKHGTDLHVSSIRLDDSPAFVNSFVRPGSEQSEARSHGFFYKPGGADQGMVGLPVRNHNQWQDESRITPAASILFLRNQSLELSELGKLDAGRPGKHNDDCQVSCYDWYGNARPLFVGGRVFALIGYDLVEGRIQNGRLDEVRRINFSPPPGPDDD